MAFNGAVSHALAAAELGTLDVTRVSIISPRSSGRDECHMTTSEAERKEI